MRPMILSSPPETMPETIVPNSSNATIDLISRRKTLLIGERDLPNAGKKFPIKMPTTRAMKIQCVSVSFFSHFMISLAFPPLEFFAQYIEIQHFGWPDQAD